MQGPVAGVSMHVSGNDNKLEWLGCRKESLEKKRLGQKKKKEAGAIADLH